MGIPVRRGARKGRRSEFDLRRTTFGFVFLALLVCGGGLAVRTALKSAERHPVAVAVLAVVLVAVLVALLRGRRVRGAAAGVAGSALGAARDAVDAALEERPVEGGVPDAGQDAGPDPDPEPVPAGGTPEDPYGYAAMDPYDFEEAVAALCGRDGCTDAEVVGGAGDLGADVVATTPDGRSLVIQCKRYTEGNKVGSQDLQRFGGTCYAVHGADTAVVVTTGAFTEPALEYAGRCGIVCVGIEGLTAWSEGSAPPPWYAEAALGPSGSFVRTGPDQAPEHVSPA
ncbi:restriction endonuclease [Streptomyces sp. NPDC058008]|uniref:restriction endonuclease n=1 Tax=Streptomyces sp. NPDC058008 TaxID=3346303 RepID=UPI0036EE203D